MIGHLLSAPKKQLLCRALRLSHEIDGLIVHSSLQRRIATNALGLRAEQVALVPYQTDERFWAPCDVPLKNQICSAGLEYRDYRTLVEAVAGLDVDVVVAAASHWSKHQGLSGQQALPPNVRVAAFDYAALRQLYAESLFVVVPLHDVENQAGITTILEAMAMGKAVVVSHTRGQTDVVRDRRRRSRIDPQRQTQPDWARMLGATEETVQGHTGIYVQPGDPVELRQAITFLIEHPDQARIMGRNGRRLIEETMGLDHFTARLATIIAGVQPAGDTAEETPLPSPPTSTLISPLQGTRR
jgi:glycosyltransferase involved in cell wall biosynthesis